MAPGLFEATRCDFKCTDDVVLMLVKSEMRVNDDGKGHDRLLHRSRVTGSSFVWSVTTP